MHEHDVTALEIEREELHGGDAGFLRVRRLFLRNLRADGSRSDRYICDFVTRPKGPDAVVIVVHRVGEGGVEVLLRRCLRPALAVGRDEATLPDGGEYPFFTEIVAGIVEKDDRGREGLLQRAAIEVEEEAGYRIEPARFEFLGAGTFPTPGSMPEKFWLMAVRVDDRDAVTRAQGDGSPMEEGGRTWWQPLHEAIAACVDGRIEDAKTELALRRLADRLV